LAMAYFKCLKNTGGRPSGPLVKLFFSLSIAAITSASSIRQKTNVPDGHWHTCHCATPYLPPVQRNSSDLGDSHKWPWSGLGGGPDPWTPRPAPPLRVCHLTTAILISLCKVQGGRESLLTILLVLSDNEGCILSSFVHRRITASDILKEYQ